MNNELFEYEINNDSVTILKYIGYQAEVDIPSEIDGNPVTIIGDSAFKDCTFLTYVSIPDSVTEIGDLAFSGCSSLISILIPDSVRKIGNSAFSSDLKSAYVPKKLMLTGNNFKNLFELVHCKCGQKFVLDPNSNINPVCPRCGLANEYVSPPNGTVFLIKILFLISCFYGSYALSYIGFCSPIFIIASILLIFSAFIPLLIDVIGIIRYEFFKASTDPDLAKRMRSSSNNKLTEVSQVESVSETSDFSTASIENADNNSDDEEIPLQVFQTSLDENKSYPHLQSLPDYHHQNVSLGCIQIPILIMIVPAIAIFVLLIIYGNFAMSLFAAVMVASTIISAIFMIRQEVSPLQITANEKGIQCNKMKPDTIPWDGVSNITFRISPVILLSYAIKTNLTITIQPKGLPKRSLLLRFNNEFEAHLCKNALEEFFRRSKLQS
ncbi:MAG: leucine-rich repeat domain-containing protein [Thermoguttaceae bacterium]|nr:leucine-rich repeat domain-containing protein [Thermoguttaceae bacterium]